MTDLTMRLIEADERPGPRAWIQWKGTNVCMDVTCGCGEQGHVDAEFAYFYACRACGALWGVGQNVMLHPLTEQEQAEVKAAGLCIATGAPETEFL